MNTKRVFFMAVLVVAVAAMAVPLVGLRTSASGTAATPRAAKAAAAKATAANSSAQQVEQQREQAGETQVESQAGKIPAETLAALGIKRAANPAEVSAKIAQKLLGGKDKKGSGSVSIQSGEPLVMNTRSALSAALATTIGGRDNQFSEVTLLADWDGPRRLHGRPRAETG
jgi:hypothetical protein